MSEPTEFDRELAFQEILFESVADLPWVLLLPYVKPMHESDLRRVITVGVMHVDAKLVRRLARAYPPLPGGVARAPAGGRHAMIWASNV